MKPRAQLTRILAWTLKGQAEPVAFAEPNPEPTVERTAEVLSGRRGFDDRERAALLRSPAARDRLRFLAEVRRAEQILQWKESAADDGLMLQAAAGGPIEPVTLSNQDFTLTLLPLDPAGQEWMLHLRLAARLVAGFAGSPLRVRDEQGATWLQGSPDADGELSAPWLLGGSPVDRLATSRLVIEPA
ncbi:hypothetical protein [uncultured Lamprocystis sp.]|jgi:hypothetical protein|uniref:hypothetical protein n=1 Tax=uncultured Lamprocystis sp. TaxID=543132 RepID=UPI0025E35886|nr:hypothetical protein [uncultured Lamprocystis sp.]